MQTDSLSHGFVYAVILSAVVGCDAEAFPPPEEPTVVFSAQFDEAGARPTSIAIDEDQVFWTSENGDLQRIDKDGSDYTVIANDTRATSHLVQTDEVLLWAFNDALVRVDDNGTMRDLATGSIIDAAARGDELFWIEYSQDTDLNRVRAMPAGGGTAVTWHQGNARWLALTEDALLVGESTADGVEISRIDVAGGGAILLATETRSLNLGITATGDHVYWSAADGVVSRVSVAGGSVEQVATELSGGFQVDDTAVFGFSESSDYTLARIAFDGRRSAIVSEERRGLGLATSDTGLYWIDWQSECLTMESSGKFEVCVEYADELRVWAVAK